MYDCPSGYSFYKQLLTKADKKKDPENHNFFLLFYNLIVHLTVWL